jgi:hypothetical protein
MKKVTSVLIWGIILLSIIFSSCEKKNHPPVLDDQGFTIPENSAVGTLAGKVIAFDEDEQPLTYSIASGNTGDAFTISSSTGNITVLTKEALDFEVNPTFNLKVEVKDSKQKSTIGNVVINITNIEISIADQVISINENSLNETIAGQIDASGQALEYSITGGNTNNAFSINADGEVIVQNTDALDFENTPVFTLTVSAKDINNEKTSFHLTVNLNNLQPPSTGLQLYLPFDGSLRDMSINNNTGIDYTTHTYVAGKKSQALDFNGVSDYVQLTNTINSQNGLSFSFWINTRGANGSENNGSIISKYSKINNTRCFMLYSFGSYETRSDNRLGAAFYAFGSSSAYHDMTKSWLEPVDVSVYPNPALWAMPNPLRLVTGEWTHCVVNMTSATIEIWLNGVLCTKKIREYTSYSTSTSEPVLIGNNYDIGEGMNNHFNGKLDEFRIYNRALTTEEIRTLYKE